MQTPPPHFATELPSQGLAAADAPPLPMPMRVGLSVCLWVWPAKLDADPELLTSLRWLAQDKKNGLHQLVLFLTRK